MSDLPIIPGATQNFEIQFKQDSGAALDLTGAGVSLVSDGAAISSSVAITDATGGIGSLSFTTAESAAILVRERVRFRIVSSGGEVTLLPWFWLSPS